VRLDAVALEDGIAVVKRFSSDTCGRSDREERPVVVDFI
jgi:hypothetical protein